MSLMPPEPSGPDSRARLQPGSCRTAHPPFLSRCPSRTGCGCRRTAPGELRGRRGRADRRRIEHGPLLAADVLAGRGWTADRLDPDAVAAHVHAEVLEVERAERK